MKSKSIVANCIMYAAISLASLGVISASIETLRLNKKQEAIRNIEQENQLAQMGIVNYKGSIENHTQLRVSDGNLDYIINVDGSKKDGSTQSEIGLAGEWVEETSGDGLIIGSYKQKDFKRFQVVYKKSGLEIIGHDGNKLPYQEVIPALDSVGRSIMIERPLGMKYP